MRAHDVSKCKMFQDSLKPQYVCMYVCMYVCVQKKNLNHTLAAISHRETMVEGSLFSLLTNAPAVEAIGASCTRQFSRLETSPIYLYIYIIIWTQEYIS